jgi:hypothetical protein
MSIVPKVFYRFCVIPIKIPTACFAEIEESILNLYRISGDPKLLKDLEKEQSWRPNAFKSML